MKSSVFLFCAINSFVACAEMSISSVIARQRYPWNGKVDISYTVSGIESAAKQNGWSTEFKVLAIDQATMTTNTATTLAGDCSLADGTHKIVWDMAEQGLNIKSTNVVFDVVCNTSKGLYCIVDLSAGSSASSYPVSFINKIPDGGWTDEYKTTKLVLRRVDPGTCVVTVNEPYYIGVFETTQKQYELINGNRPSYFSGDTRPVESVSYNTLRGTSKGSQYPTSTEVDDTSVMGKLRLKTGMHCDLPKESQWEYACRAGATTTYSYGSTANDAYMWYYSNAGSVTHIVGTKLPNDWGLYDMYGNAWEWCLEWYSSSRRVIRGGAYHYSASECSSAFRAPADQSHEEYEDGGFRLCITLE